VIDAGWYAERNEDWSSTVGAWQPSTTRWPRGIRFVLDRIREKGMVPGLWLEPEVAGKHSTLAEKPDSWFFLRLSRYVVRFGSVPDQCPRVQKVVVSGWWKSETIPIGTPRHSGHPRPFRPELPPLASALMGAIQVLQSSGNSMASRGLYGRRESGTRATDSSPSSPPDQTYIGPSLTFIERARHVSACGN